MPATTTRMPGDPASTTTCTAARFFRIRCGGCGATIRANRVLTSCPHQCCCSRTNLPETGAFYVETALPGDVLVVHLTRVRLNRDWAISDDGIVGRALDSDFAVKMKDGFKSVRWHLDRQRGLAMPEKPTAHLNNFTVPIRPM